MEKEFRRIKQHYYGQNLRTVRGTNAEGQAIQSFPEMGQKNQDYLFIKCGV